MARSAHASLFLFKECKDKRDKHGHKHTRNWTAHPVTPMFRMYIFWLVYLCPAEKGDVATRPTGHSFCSGSHYLGIIFFFA